MDYLETNKRFWNDATSINFGSDFYDQESFEKGRNSLNSIELELLGEVTGKSVLHLQCHFGQDTISLQRLGALATGVDLSDKAIEKAQQVSTQLGLATRFICSDIYDLPNHLNEQFDIVFTSYGTIGWLPDIDKWAAVVQRYLKPGGQFVFAEFHPAVWMWNDDFTEITYTYLRGEAISEIEEGTYADKSASSRNAFVCWNHGIGEVVTALLGQGLHINALREFDYSPYPCFSGVEEREPGMFQIKKFGNKMPMVYALKAVK